MFLHSKRFEDAIGIMNARLEFGLLGFKLAIRGRINSELRFMVNQH